MARVVGTEVKLQLQTRGDVALSLSLPTQGGAKGNSPHRKRQHQTWAQGGGTAVEIPHLEDLLRGATRKKAALWGLLPPFPRNS